MATVKSSAENLTLNADGSGNDILFQSNGSQVGSLTAEGVFTATSFAGSGASLTGLSSFDPDGAVVFNDSHADVDFRVESDVNTHQLFVDGGNDIVMIDQVANPGTVLRSSEPAHLQIKGNDAASASVSISRHSANASPPALIFYKSRNTSVGSYTAIQDNDNLGNIDWIVDDGTDDNTKAAQISVKVNGTPGANDAPAEMIFSTTADGANDYTERLNIGSEGNVTVSTGNLVIGTTGKGIDFSVTGEGSGLDGSAAELLDDYEEGNWNPSFSGSSGSAGSLGIGGWDANYTKIGRLVVVQFLLTLTHKGSWGGEVRLTGLPFSVEQTMPAAGSIELSNVTFVGGEVGNVTTYVTAGVTYFRFRFTRDNNTSSMMQVSQCSNTSEFNGMFSYTTTNP